MKILYVFHSLAYWGGIERILVDKMNYLASEYGYDVYMLTTGQGNHPVPYFLSPLVHLEDLNIRMHQQYQYHGLKRLLVNWQLTRLFKKRLADRLDIIRPDVIACTTASYLEIDLITKLKNNIPLVIESHSVFQRILGQKGLRNKYVDYIYHRGFSKSQVLVALTEGDAQEWREIHSNVKVIPNMVHLNDGKMSSLNNKSVIWVGRLDYQKRPLEMVEIWKKVYPQFPDWGLDMYGEGEQLQELRHTVQQLNMNINIHQPTEQIFDAYRYSSIFVSTSLFEPFGLVIPEAMSCGLPVVAYDCPYGPSSILSDGSNGFLVQNDNRQAFADTLCRLMADTSLRHRIGGEALEASKRFSAEKIMPLWHDLFENLASQESRENASFQIE
jgi:glycosyltransferase involved in cell wall biosynthesis